MNVSGVRLTDEQVEWLNAMPDDEAELLHDDIGGEIIHAVWDALSVSNESDAAK